MKNTSAQNNFLGPFVVMVILLFLVGFLTVVNQQFQGPLKAALLKNAGDLTFTLTTMITFSWFLAYPLTGGIGASWVDKYGYKKTLLRALIVLIVGLGIFELSVLQEVYAPYYFHFGNNSIPLAFFIFLIGSFTVGSSATILQVVVNPYLVASTVKGTSGVQRLNIGNAGNSIGTTIAPYFVSGIIFGSLAMEQIHVKQLIYPFLGLIIVIVMLSFLINNFKLPNIEGTTNETGEKLEKSIWSFSHLALGVVGLFCYVGVEVGIGANINLYAEYLGYTGNVPALMASLYWGGMLVGRLASSLVSNISASTLLKVAVIFSLILVVLGLITHNPWIFVGVGLFHSVMWPSIFMLAIEKLGKYTSKGSGTLMIGVLGGGIIPLLMGIILDITTNWSIAWGLILLGELYIVYYAFSGHKVITTVE